MKKWIPVFFITIFLLFIAELSAYFILKKSNEQQYLFYNRAPAAASFGLEFMNECCGYNQADPFLGWEMSDEQLKKRNLHKAHNCIYFENMIPGAKDTLCLFISGGSTTDVGLIAHNWPALLRKKLQENKVCFQLYIASVGGYSSSQELLKLIRDGIPLQPDIHISYCGANEYENPYFVSGFEQDFYDKVLNKKSNDKLLPNILYLVKKKLAGNSKQLQLKEFPKTDAVAQWKNNMQMMQALAASYNYTFIGILQPVAGFGGITKYKQDAGTLEHVKQYQHFYPDALAYVKTSNYLLDFTSVFGNMNEPFTDDCHVKENFQPVLADSILSILTKKVDLLKYQ